jgi:hypothetical protein
MCEWSKEISLHILFSSTSWNFLALWLWAWSVMWKEIQNHNCTILLLRQIKTVKKSKKARLYFDWFTTCLGSPELHSSSISFLCELWIYAALNTDSASVVTTTFFLRILWLVKNNQLCISLISATICLHALDNGVLQHTKNNYFELCLLLKFFQSQHFIYSMFPLLEVRKESFLLRWDNERS